MIEAMACGLPAAFPAGPIDVVKEGVSGVLHEDLQTACHQAVQLPKTVFGIRVPSRGNEPPTFFWRRWCRPNQTE